MKASPELQQYFKLINKELKKAYSAANEARKKGHDPEKKVDISLASNMAERVEGLISVVAPQIIGSGVSKRIEELEKKYGTLAWEVALRIAEEVADEKFCKFKDKKEAMEVGIRTGFAYHTVGVVAAPLEGFIELKIKKRKDGKEYFAAAYAGPIRGAGGTAAAFSLILIDYIRQKHSYSTYDPDENEIKRYVTELEDYHERVTNLQYHACPEEIEFLIKNLPVEIDGEPSEKIEVSNYKDLPRVETNFIRSGVCLVTSMLALKAPKVWKGIQKFWKEFNLDWSFLEEYLKMQKSFKAREDQNNTTDSKIKPDHTYISDLVAGRPVLTHPLRMGGFRLRYGRSRTSGFSCVSIHPATMQILENYIAVGTQLKLERPGKAAAVTSCDSLEGPIVKLNNGEVVRIENEKGAKQIINETKEILFLGDILISYGDFFDRAHQLVPAGYCEEWYVRELEKAMVSLFGSYDLDKLSELVDASKEELILFLKNPFTVKPSAKLSINLSQKLNIPLHPRYTYYWTAISTQELVFLINWLENRKLEKKGNEIIKLILPADSAKRILELIGLPHKFINNEYVVIEKDDSISLLHSTGLINKTIEKINQIIEINKQETTLKIINILAGTKIKDKGGTFIGARMGRPEKAKMRRLTGSPQVLFPVGEEGGRLRCFQSALEKNKITADFPTNYCARCNKKTIYPICEICGNETRKIYNCSICGELEKPCQHPTKTHKPQPIDITHYFNNTLEMLKTKTYPDLVKGVRGTSNKEHIPEHLIKGVLRAKHNLCVNKDGTIRYDMTELPITHFRPKEIGTPIKKLIELGYTKDIKNKPLEEENQILELKPQDLILPSSPQAFDENADDLLFRIAQFVDELLISFYKQKPYYSLEDKSDLVGKLVIGIAPHISAGIVGRIIGFSKTQSLLAHPLYHAAMRRDCLGFDNYVSIKQNGNWQIKKIGEFVEDMNPNIKVDVFGALKKDTCRLCTWGNSGQKNILEVTKHPPRKMLEIKLEDGREIKLTENHKVYIKGKKEKRAYNLKKGDKLIVSYKREVEENEVKEIFLPEIFQEREEVMLRNVRSYLCKFEKLSKHENFCFRDGFPIKFVKELLERHGKTLRDLPSETKIAIKRDNIEIPIRISLDEEFLELIGLYIAEGFCRKKEGEEGFYQVYISSNDGNIKKLIKERFLKYFNLKPSEDHKDYITFSSRIVYELLQDYLKIGNKAKNKRIPSLFLNLKKEKIAALLRGYFEGDGSVSLSDIRVTCDTVSEGLKYDLSFVLSRFEIFTKFYDYEKEPGPKVKEFYLKKGKEIPKFQITKIIIPSNFVKKFKEIRFISERKNKILKELCKKIPYSMKIDFDDNYIYPRIRKIREIGEETNYCFNVDSEHNFFTNDILVHNCDGDEACIILLMDALLNFSRQYLPDSRGARTMDTPLVLTSTLIPAEVDDMVHKMDITWNYPLELYEAALLHKLPWEVKIEQLGDNLNTEKQYEQIGYTHDTDNINSGVLCSAYKLLPSMEEKLKGQMRIAEKLRAVDTTDVARLVIEKHFLKDIKGNLRKFSTQQFRCVKCNKKYRRPPLIGQCDGCNGKIIFTISEGSIIKYLTPAISLAEKYSVPPYLRQSLQLTKQRVEDVFGKESERQEGLGKWF